MQLLLALLGLQAAAAYNVAGVKAGVPARAAASRTGAVHMDETIFEKALAGELEQEGADNVFLSEVGWATYLDKEAGSSYNMNQRPSMADDGYFTPSMVDNPLDVVTAWIDNLKDWASDPATKSFVTITNDPTGARSWPKGLDEVKARTIKPKVKDFDPKKRIVGIPGFNAFGTPSSKQESKGAFFGLF